MLRVLGEQREEKAKHLMSLKAEGKKLKDIVVVRNFSELFPDDLSGLPLSREIESCIDLIPGAMSVAKSPYRLAPYEIEELPSQLRELHDKGFIRPSSSLWGAPVKMNDPNITIEEYIRLEEEKARRRAIVFNDTLTSEAALSCEPTVSSLNNDKINFRISFDESDEEDCTVIFDKNSFSYKIISVNDLKIDSENDNDKVDMPLLPSPEPMVSYFDDLDYFKYFDKEFLAIVYNDALTSKLDFLTEPVVIPQHIDEFNLKNKTSFSKYDEKEQNVLYFNDLFPFNVIYPDD
ncbi:hypothetical protein Tco_1082800 [Tanacetum coccineum]|uniref:Reverse transcriptase domain-containing protein n=1 Tax=Tanacetum coccineum TaxID=301880 RepID=A0ABQ5I1J4_9ASTR